jgi:hypothetical protein
MPAYTPAVLRTPTAITASYATVIDPASVIAVIRTFDFNVVTTAHKVYMSQNAGADATLIVPGYTLTADVPYIVNTWIVIPDADTVQVKADSVATNAPTFGAWGYTYV